MRILEVNQFLDYAPRENATAGQVGTTVAHTFTPEERSNGGRNGVRTQVANRATQSLNHERTYRLVTAAEQGAFGQRVLETALKAANKLDEGLDDFPLDDSIDHYRLSQVLETLFKVYRLDTGQSTSNVLTHSVDAIDLQARLSALQATELPGTDTPAS